MRSGVIFGSSVPVLSCDAFQLSLVSASLKGTAEASLPGALCQQPVGVRECGYMTLPVVLKKPNKSFLSWAISPRYAKAKGEIAFLNRLDFVSGSLQCSYVRSQRTALVQKLLTRFSAAARIPWKITQVPGYTFCSYGNVVCG